MPELYPLESLLDVRRYREKAAENNVVAARHALQSAHEKLLEEEASLARWRAWREEETERRYAGILGKVVPVEAMLAFNQGLAALEGEAIAREMRIAEAREDCAQKEKRVESAQAAVKKAHQNTAKIEKHKSIWAEEAKLEAERAEEREFEEFKAPAGLSAALED